MPFLTFSSCSQMALAAVSMTLRKPHGLGIGIELGKSVVKNYQQCSTQDNSGGRVNLLIPCFSEKRQRREN